MPMGGKMAYEDEKAPVFGEVGDLNDAPIFDADGDLSEEDLALLEALGIQFPGRPMAGQLPDEAQEEAPLGIAHALAGTEELEGY